ncbi:aldolase/citrate lyase family protein [Serinicoccus sp. LYQ131]|uniref:aldolase/citrate lyase family protein n=1 Tax=Serinicoccus sp. LYQ131 TaxID=3378797 RepID=UPI0038547842
MTLDLMQITSDPALALEAEKSGVETIFVDLETLGKKDRQGHLNTVISNHTLSDASQLKQVLKTAKMLVRVNPLNSGSSSEIDAVVKLGADTIMLPFFTSVHEVSEFLRMVDGRASTCLLFETPESVTMAAPILRLTGIDSAHVGLNDLHIGLKLNFMFELLTNGFLEPLLQTLRTHEIPFGIGGIARLGKGAIPAELIIAEHYRLGSTAAILSRQFLQVDGVGGATGYAQEVAKIRAYEKFLETCDSDYLLNNYAKLQRAVGDVVDQVKEAQTKAR